VSAHGCIELQLTRPDITKGESGNHFLRGASSGVTPRLVARLRRGSTTQWHPNHEDGALRRKEVQNDFGTAGLDSPVEVANPQLSVIQRFNVLCDRSKIRI
jgi:hypothetical protein